jgi:hypothetical protein
MTGFIVNVSPFRNRVSSKEAFEGLELGEGKPSRPVLRGPGGRKAAWLLGSQLLLAGDYTFRTSYRVLSSHGPCSPIHSDEIAHPAVKSRPAQPSGEPLRN